MYIFFKNNNRFYKLFIFKKTSRASRKMITCAVYGCPNNTATVIDPNIQYYYFPKQSVTSQLWVSACWRSDPIDIDTACICSIHFDTDSYTAEFKMLDYLGGYTRMLKDDAVPTLYLPTVMKYLLDPSVTISSRKEIMIYQVQQPDNPVTANVESSFQNMEQITLKLGVLNNTHEVARVTEEDLALKKLIAATKDTINRLKRKLESKEVEEQKRAEELRRLTARMHRLHIKSLTLNQQKKLLSKVFSESQIKILTGKKKIYWSNDDMAVAYTIRHLSNKSCYHYLTKKLNIPLPALSSIKRWTTLKKNEYIKETHKVVKNEESDSD